VTGDQHPGKLRIIGTHGFTLIEVMIVMLIAGILATGVVFMFANPNARVKTVAFELLGNINMVRSEAVTRNEDALVYFLDNVSEQCQDNITQCTVAGNFDGYIICIDLDSPANGECNPTDTIIKTALFDERVQFYDPTVLPVDGPSKTPDGTASMIGTSGIILDDATPTEVTGFTMEPDGTLEDGITENINVVIYAPTKNNHNDINGTPFDITVSSSSGRVRINRWIMGGDWSRK
jgi:prepilin-type N-terminal cleavage/methylation domain-containing protein